MTLQPSSSSPDTSTGAKRSSPWPWILLILVLVPMLACGIFAVISAGGVIQVVNLVQDILDGGELVVRDQQPAIITQVQALGRLETASYTIEKVIEGNVDQGNELLNFFLGDRLLLISHGDVTAGVDLAELREQDIEVSQDRQAVTLRLPAARILNHRLDNDLSYVYDRQRGLLTKGDPQLETEVRRAAEQQILQAACNGDILSVAAENAQQQVRALLLSLGFSEIEFLPAREAGTTGCD